MNLKSVLSSLKLSNKNMKLKSVLLGLFCFSFFNTAQAVSFCDRTEAVQKEILELFNKAHCSEIKQEDLTRISSLDLSYRNLTSLKSGDFEGMDNLKALILSYNKLTELPEKIFNRLVSLKFLDLSHNQLTTLPDSLLYGLANLKILLLDNNQLTEIQNELLVGSTLLERFSAINNKIHSIESNAFFGLNSIKDILLDGNNLRTFPSIRSTTLQTISLTNNELTSLSLKDASQVTYVYLSNNNLSELKKDFISDDNKSLREFIIEENPIKSLPTGISSRKNVTIFPETLQVKTKKVKSTSTDKCKRSFLGIPLKG